MVGWLMESAPVVIVFTKYDKLVRTKRAELQEYGDGDSLSEDALHEKSREESQKALDICIQSLERTLRSMETPKSQTPKLHYVNVSGMNFPWFICSVLICLPDRRGYEDTILSLVQVTCDLVSDMLKLIPPFLGRQVKINASVK